MSAQGLSDETIQRRMRLTEAERATAQRKVDEYGIWLESKRVVREVVVGEPCTLCGESIEDGKLVFPDRPPYSHAVCHALVVKQR